LRARRGEAEPVDDVVEAAIQALQQHLAGDPLAARRLLEGQAELVLQNAVDPLDLLLLAQLHAVALQLDATLAVLSGREIALLDRALLGEAAVALQAQLHPLPAAEPADGASDSRHVFFPRP